MRFDQTSRRRRQIRDRVRFAKQLTIWIRLMGALGTPSFNFKIVK